MAGYKEGDVCQPGDVNNTSLIFLVSKCRLSRWQYGFWIYRSSFPVIIPYSFSPSLLFTLEVKIRKEWGSKLSEGQWKCVIIFQNVIIIFIRWLNSAQKCGEECYFEVRKEEESEDSEGKRLRCEGEEKQWEAGTVRKKRKEYLRSVLWRT